MTVPNIVVCLKGSPKTGKTHYALTFPCPIIVYSFDRGAKYIAGKSFKGKDITVHEYVIPVMETDPPTSYATPFYSALRKQLDEDLKSRKAATIIYDPAPALWELVRQAYAEEEHKAKLGFARNYAAPNARMTYLLMQPTMLGMNVVSINHLKDKYIDDKLTGEEILEGFKHTEGLADVILATKFNRETKKVITTIELCRFDKELSGQVLEPDGGYPELMAMLGL